jgi:hypothetical protein
MAPKVQRGRDKSRRDAGAPVDAHQPPIVGLPPITSTAAPRTRPLLSRSRAKLACSSGKSSTHQSIDTPTTPDAENFPYEMFEVCG